jgi:hypothetical protein
VRTARPNVFQRLARTWDAVHPYNAGQACRVAGDVAPAALEAAWDAALSGMGLGRVRAHGDGYRYEPAPGWPMRHLGADDDLSRHFTSELNRPFTDPAEPPFRPFARAVNGSTWLGIVYQHWVADSESVRTILHEWLARAVAPRAARPDPVPLVRCRSRDVTADWRCGHWSALETLLALARRHGDNRRVRKIHTFGPLDYPVRVRLFPAPPGVLPGLLAYARARDVSLNDVLLAALAETCDRLIPAQQRPGRDDLAVSAVANLRPGLRPTLGGGFGCLLGFTSTVCRRGDLNRWDRLLTSVACQSRAQRRAGVGPASVLWMFAAELASRHTPPSRIYDFFRKEIPLSAGISNVNANRTWLAGDGAPLPVLEYVRVSPTGPIVPVALAVTSLRDGLQLSLTYRSALLNDWTATELMQVFTRRLERLARAGGRGAGPC